MGPRHECGVADNGDPVEGEPWAFQVVDRLQDRLVDQPHDGAELRRQQSLGRRPASPRSDRGGSDAKLI
jgi:hypothetical protein